MTTYSFKPLDSTQSVNWSNPSVWAGGMVPNSPDADVDFPTVTYVATGQPYTSFVTIQAGETFTTHSVALRDYLQIHGSLNVAADLTQYASGEINLDQGVLSAGSLTNNAYDIQGSGQIIVNSLTNNTLILASGNLSVIASTLTNTGTLAVIGGSTFSVNVTPGGFTNLAGGTLSGGSYTSYSGSTLAINAGGIISTDAASIMLDGGAVTSHDPVSGQDVPITTSLTSIASSGTLAIQSGSYMFGPLAVSGDLTLSGSAQLASSQFVVGIGGALQGIGFVNSPVENDGVILAGQAYTNGLVLNGAITGNGHLEVSAGSGALLELNGATAQNVLFDSNVGTLQIDHPATFTGTITPSGMGDKIILSGVSASSISGTSYTGDASSGTLALQQADGGTTSLHFVGNYTSSSFILSAGPQLLSSDPPSLAISVGQTPASIPVCFVAGTHILTSAGERAVEALRIGDRVKTWAGKTKAITWIGSGTSVVSRNDPRSRPVIVRAGALADRVPCRDLRLTEGHSLLVDGFLMPVACLINGHSILWDEEARIVTFYHVELPDHDILVADGAPAESYREDSNRLSFSRADGARNPAVVPTAAPVLTEGAMVDAAWRRLVARSGGAIDELSDDPDLHLIVDGQRVDPALIEQDRYRFILNGTPNTIVIGSRSVVPALVGTARDCRRLGVALRRIVLASSDAELVLDHSSDLLVKGFHEAENNGRLRWTDGRGKLPMAAFAPSAQLELTLDVVCFARYPTEIAEGMAGMRLDCPR